jgi:hypothetical protein
MPPHAVACGRGRMSIWTKGTSSRGRRTTLQQQLEVYGLPPRGLRLDGYRRGGRRVTSENGLGRGGAGMHQCRCQWKATEGVMQPPMWHQTPLSQVALTSRDEHRAKANGRPSSGNSKGEARRHAYDIINAECDLKSGGSCMHLIHADLCCLHVNTAILHLNSATQTCNSRRVAPQEGGSHPYTVAIGGPRKKLVATYVASD